MGRPAIVCASILPPRIKSLFDALRPRPFHPRVLLPVQILTSTPTALDDGGLCRLVTRAGPTAGSPRS